MAEEKVLIDKTVFPTDEVLKPVLRNTFTFYQDLLGKTGDFGQEWSFVSKKSGWNLKVVKKNKALLWLFPYQDFFRIAFAVREHEKELILNSDLRQDYKDLLTASKKYKEGYALRIDVVNEENYGEVLKVVDILKQVRK